MIKAYIAIAIAFSAISCYAYWKTNEAAVLKAANKAYVATIRELAKEAERLDKVTLEHAKNRDILEDESEKQQYKINKLKEELAAAGDKCVNANLPPIILRQLESETDKAKSPQ